MARLRILLHGLLSGALLSFLRAPLGLDWTQVPAVDGRSAGLLRAGALLGIALGLGLQGNAFRGAVPAWWCLAALAGFATHGLIVQPWDPIETRFAFALALVATTLGLRFLAGRRSSRTADDARANAATLEHLGRSERFGLVLTGFGCAIALEGLARELRLFGLGLTLDDTVFGSVFLALVFVGAVAFGPLLVHAKLERAALAGGLALAAGGTVFGLSFLARLDQVGLAAYLHRFESLIGPLKSLDERWAVDLGLAGLPALDNASIGTGWSDAALAAGALVVPCFLLGAGLGAARHTGRWAHALCGAALGLLIGPYLLRASGEPIAASELARTPWAWNWCVTASVASALGALFVALGSSKRERVIGFVLAGAACLLPWVHPRLVVWSFSPWYHATVQPELVFPTDSGLVTVEVVRGTRIVTLDRKRMSPTAEDEPGEERAFRYAWSLVPAAKKEAGAVRTLFVGQMTPARARVLQELGPLELERTAAWFPAFEAVESLLFAGESPPPGTAVAPAEARARLAEGAYDLVLSPAFHGPCLLWRSHTTSLWASADTPAIGGLSLPDDTLGVAWVSANSNCARRELGERIALTEEHLENFQIGIVRGTPAVGEEQAVQLLPAGEPVDEPGALELLVTLPNLRPFLFQHALGERLKAAGTGTSQAELARGFAIHLGAQKLSSPFETRAQSIELEEDSLRAFLAAVPASGALDPLMRDLWEDVAWLLTEKRSPDLALVYLESLAERFQPWGVLDRALARAYREHLEPGIALRYLERSMQSRKQWDLALWVECAECSTEMGDHERAAGYYERALSLLPGNFELRKRRALALQAAGDPNGSMLLEELLLEQPDDPEILSGLGLPAPPEGSGGGTGD